MVKTKTKTYSMSEMARACDVSTASISALVKRLKLKPVETGENNSKRFNDEDFRTIKRYYQHKVKPKPKAEKSTKDELIAQLRAENAFLKAQIEVKDHQIEASNTLIDHAQQLDLAHSKEKALPEHKEAETASHGFWWHVFH